MSQTSHELIRMRQLLLSTMDKPRLEALKRLVRNYNAHGGVGQEAVNRAVVRALIELHHRLDSLIRV